MRKSHDPPDLDELYGLEPVIEPGSPEAACAQGLQSRVVQCPYCGEDFETTIDLSAGSMSYIEDCRVCCRPIEFRLEVGGEGTAASLAAGRSD